jgi:hypothetical protein
MKIKKVKPTKLSAGQLVFDLEPNQFIAPTLFEVMAVDEEDDQIILKPIGDVGNYTAINGYVYFPLNRYWFVVK